MRTSRPVLFVAVPALATALVAQCPYGTMLATTSGAGCGTGLTVTATLTPAPCTLTLSLTGSGGSTTCTATFLLALGVTSATVPLPELGPACTLLVQPDAVLLAPTAGFLLAIPPAVPAITVHLQGAVWQVCSGYPPLGSFHLSPRTTLALQ